MGPQRKSAEAEEGLTADVTLKQELKDKLNSVRRGKVIAERVSCRENSMYDNN